MLCPKCKAEISYLKHYQSGEYRYDFELDEKGNAVYKRVEFQANDGTCDYECPECAEVLACSEEDAIKILKGEEGSKDEKEV